MAQHVALREREAEALDRAMVEAARAGWVAEGDGPITAGFLLNALMHGRRHGLLGPGSPVLLEDPKYTRPWQIRGMRVENSTLLLDVWGA